MNSSESQQNLINNEAPVASGNGAAGPGNYTPTGDYILGPVEKHFLLSAERGDCATVRRLIEDNRDRPDLLNINCVDPLNRSALIAAIENENYDLIMLLLEMGIQVKDSLLHAIKEEYVEAVEVLLEHEEKIHKPGQPYSWEAVDRSASNFTPDITPLILAAHMNNYEILKILLDRGATLPTPHDVRCGCDECVNSSETDSLRHSQSRINAYKALSSSSLIALSSRDPLLTAFELSWELRRLSRLEQEFRSEYEEMRENVMVFATSLLDHARTSNELEIMLNYNPTGDNWEPGERQTLERLKLAIKYKQKMFVAHPNVQQLLAKIWYDGLPGFRRLSMLHQLIEVGKLGAQFPVYSTIYMLSPNSPKAMFMKKPFVKFICHSSSYAFFLMLLGAASQRIEHLAIELFGPPWLKEILAGWKKRERGAIPGLVESGVIIYVISLVVGEVRSLWSGGLIEYISDLWNIVDFIQNIFYVIWICMRGTSWFVVMREYWSGEDPWYPRDHWHDFEPMLLSEGAFAVAMIFSFLKLVHIFSVNPHLGPLQISLGRMIIDIIKFFFIYTLVLFAFGCGMNQLLWYYADLEMQKCYHLPSGLPDFDNNEKACSTWRRFANLFETSQSLFWASFGMVDLMSFDLTGIKSFTRFWALLMFGSYSVINIIVLLNMLIAMMSNSYQIISERADTEWKFARSHLWMSYFEDGDTVPPPFNMIPTVKTFDRIMKCGKGDKPTRSVIKKNREKAKDRHDTVMRLLIRRYVTTEQSKTNDFSITEDDVMEIRQDISTLRYELIDIFKQNGYKTPDVDDNKDGSALSGKKGRVMERRLQKDFQIGFVEGLVSQVIREGEKGTKDVFSQIAKAIGRRTSGGGGGSKKKKDWNEVVRQNTIPGDPIGSTNEQIDRMHRRSLKRHLQHQGNSALESLDPQRLLEYNPNLEQVSNTTKIAYAKFMLKRPAPKDAPADAAAGGAEGGEAKPPTRSSQRVAITEPAKGEDGKPAPPSRALSTLAKKSLSKSGSQDKSGRSLEAKPSTEGRTPSPIPEEPGESGKSDAAAKAASMKKKSSMKKQPSSAAPPAPPGKDDKPKEEKPKEEKPKEAKQKITTTSNVPPPEEMHPTTKQRGRSKATGQIVGGWI